MLKKRGNNRQPDLLYRGKVIGKRYKNYVEENKYSDVKDKDMLQDFLDREKEFTKIRPVFADFKYSNLLRCIDKITRRDNTEMYIKRFIYLYDEYNKGLLEK